MADESRESVILEDTSDTEGADQSVHLEVGAAPPILNAPRGKKLCKNSGAKTSGSGDKNFSLFSSVPESSQRPPLYQFGQGAGASFSSGTRNVPFTASHVVDPLETSSSEISATARQQQQWLPNPQWFSGANFPAANPFYGGFLNQNPVQMQVNQLAESVKRIEEKLSAHNTADASPSQQSKSSVQGKEPKESHSRTKNTRKTHEISDNEDVYSDVSSDEQDYFSSDSEEEGEIKSATSTSLFKDLAKDITKDNNIPETETEVGSSNLDKLDKLSQEFECKEAYGPKVNEKLARTVNMGLKSNFSASTCKELSGKYKTPENCEWVRVPLINNEIWSSDSLQENYKTNDKLFYKNQSLITKAMIPIIQIMNNCIEKKNESETFDLACDAFQLLAYAHRDESNIRRQMLKPAVHKSYRKLCNPSTPVTENLFGDDLQKQIKDIYETRKFTNDFSSSKLKRKSSYGYQQSSKRTRYGDKDFKNYSRQKSFLDKRARPYQKKPKSQGQGRKQ